jgi:hypothetical protein
MQFKETITTTGELLDGKIANVKILGYESKNGRTYSKAAVNNAKGLYEGAFVYVNHSKDVSRKVEDKFGDFHNIQVKDDGLYGDLTYLETHPVAPMVKECISKNLNYFGMSHSVLGSSKKVNGKEVVESIDSVESVDLVASPATNKGFFEQIEEQVIEPDEEIIDVIEEENNVMVDLMNKIKDLEEEIKELKETKKVKISEVICQPMTIENTKQTGPTDLKKFFQECK